MRKIDKKGFTLFELLLVLIIISLVYYLIVPTNLFLKRESSKDFTFKELKRYLSTFSQNKKITLLCTDECKKCKIFDGNKTIDTDIFKNKRVEAFRYRDNYLQEIRFFAPKLADTYEEICFKYSYYPKKEIGDELFAKYDGKVYYFSPYFQDTKVFNSIEEAKEFYEKNLRNLRD